MCVSRIHAIFEYHCDGLLKFLHTLGAIGLLGAMASLAAVMIDLPGHSSAAALVAVLGSIAQIATWVLMPSMALTLIAGLLAIAVNPAYHDAGWAWFKAATGILVFEGTLLYVIGPLQALAKSSALALASHLDPKIMASFFDSERNTIWLLSVVALVNVLLGIWRPRLRIPV